MLAFNVESDIIYFSIFICFYSRKRTAIVRRPFRPTGKSGRHQRLFTLLPIARAQFVRLQPIQPSQYFLRIAADAAFRHVRKTDDAVRIDEERRALRHALFRIENAERAGKALRGVGQHGERQIAQILMILAPCQMHELAIGARGQDLAIAILELLIQIAEALDLRRANEGEILRIEKHAKPFAFVRVVRDREKGLLDAFGRNSRLEVELRKFIANGKHMNTPVERFVGGASRAPYQYRVATSIIQIN